MLYKIRNAKVFVWGKLVDSRWSAAVKTRYIHDAHRKFAEMYRDQNNLSKNAKVEIYGYLEAEE